MSVKLREWKTPTGQLRQAWQVFVRGTCPDGREVFHRRVLKGGTKREAQQIEAEIRTSIRAGTYRSPDQPRTDVPTVDEWATTFLVDRKANQRKPSSIDSIETVLRRHILPAMGAKRLDAVTDEDVRQLKVKVGVKQNGQPAAASTVRNVLTVLNAMLKLAVDEGKLRAAPRIKFPRVPVREARFFDRAVFDSMASAAAEIDARVLVLVLLGGEAGLRRGECIGLEWGDVSFARQTLTVRRSVWEGVAGTTKGNAERVVPMTARLASALQRLRLQAGAPTGRILQNDAGKDLDRDDTKVWIKKIERRLGLPQTGRLHIFRHTFCSRLATAGASAKAIQELAGHSDIRITSRYMHLAPGERAAAIRLLEKPADAPSNPAQG